MKISQDINPDFFLDDIKILSYDNTLMSWNLRLSDLTLNIVGKNLTISEENPLIVSTFTNYNPCRYNTYWDLIL